MSPHSKTLILAALAFCALAFAQGPLPPGGGGAGPGAPGGGAVNGLLLNQTANAAATTIATCPAGTTPFCTYLVGVQLECNAANPGTGSGNLTGNLVFSDVFTANYAITLATLNVATCSAFASNNVSASWLPRYILARAGSTVQYSVTGTITGSYNYDLGWTITRIS